MPICKECQIWFGIIGGNQHAYDCQNGTGSHQKKRFSIKTSGKTFCRIDIDEIMSKRAVRCDFIFARNNNPPNPWKNEIFVVELAGNAKKLDHCYDQLKATIQFLREKNQATKCLKLDRIEGIIVGGTAKTVKRVRNKSDISRTLQQKFVRENLGRRLYIERGPRFPIKA